jgi:LCP family protein required for cell wall assembly
MCVLMRNDYRSPQVDPSAETRPNYVVETWGKAHQSPRHRSYRKILSSGCLVLVVILACFFVFSSVYLFMPFRTNLLILGIDRSPEDTYLGRSDTNILITVLPLRPYVGMLSIPRDLWVEIPYVGENRINTAHFFAEGEEPGSGPAATMSTIQKNFGVNIKHYIRIRFDGVTDIINALGGLDIELDSPMAGYPAGDHHLSGEQALAFIRDRQGTDDFFRMEQGQFFIMEMVEQLIQPKSWILYPGVFTALSQSIDTNLPPWIWPRIGFAILRLGLDDIDNRVINREFVTPMSTSEGAQVLLPNWLLIDPIVDEIFGQ